MSGLSSRGERFTEAGTVREQISEVWENVYHTENNAGGTINLGTAENYVMLDDVAAFVNDKIQVTGSDVDYGAGPWGSSRLRMAMAAHINKYFGPLKVVDGDEFVFATGCTSICEMLGFALFAPGEGILLSRPIYQAFKNDFHLRAEVECEFVSFQGQNQFTTAAVQIYEDAIDVAKSRGIRIRALLLCNPHNPLGQCYEPSALIAYMQLCQKHRIHLIIDEIYALSTYRLASDSDQDVDTATQFRSILSFEMDKYIDPAYLHLLYGFSKDLASGGLRLGCLWTRNAALRSALSSLTFFSWPSNLCERVAIAMLEDEQWLDTFIHTSRQRLAERSAVARAVLEEYGIAYDASARAGFFLWADFRALLSTGAQTTWDQHHAFKQQLRKHKVYISSGDSLSSELPGFFRLCFVKPEAEVRLGMKRVMQAVAANARADADS